MMPALDWLGLHAKDLLGANPSPGIFYWGTGILSAVLDNAPTYLGFFSALSGGAGEGAIPALLTHNSMQLLGISIGAVFFGAATYIGNGPNFMVKAIADRHKIPTPSFPGFVLRFTLPYLLPVLITIWLLYFRS
jgi:Na+/H+ antiporter NhaD/arsenite permease-like protein